MTHLLIKLDATTPTAPCALCGGRLAPSAGPRLFLATGAAVCQRCGQKHAPPLAALLDLARVADRVGRIARHTLVPPLGALLDLTRAAENYTCSAPGPGRQAA